MSESIRLECKEASPYKVEMLMDEDYVCDGFLLTKMSGLKGKYRKCFGQLCSGPKNHSEMDS